MYLEPAEAISAATEARRATMDPFDVRPVVFDAATDTADTPVEVLASLATPKLDALVVAGAATIHAADSEIGPS
jgi:hypothetical protein